MAIESAGWIIVDKILHLNAQGRAASASRLAPGHEDWWLAFAPGAAPSPLNFDLPLVVPGRKRHPRNVVMDADTADVLDEAGGVRKSGNYSGLRSSDKHRHTYASFKGTSVEKPIEGDVGGLSRYFSVYAPKARFSERLLPNAHETEHPTAKSVEFMRWLLRLLNPPSGSIIGDPFCGSGATLEAAESLDYGFWGCDLEDRWVQEAKIRTGL